MSSYRRLKVIIKPVKCPLREHIKKVRLLLPCEYLDPLCHKSESALKHLFNPCNRPYLILLFYYLILLHCEFDVVTHFLGLRAKHQVGV